MNGILASSSTVFLSSICTCNCHLVTVYIYPCKFVYSAMYLLLSYSCIYLFVFNTFRVIVKEKWQRESLVQKYCCDFVITVQTVRHCQLNLVKPIYDCAYSHKSHNGYYVCGSLHGQDTHMFVYYKRRCNETDNWKQYNSVY